MSGGIFTRETNDLALLNQCKCGQAPNVIWHYVKGIANHINYFSQCPFCKTRTRNRKHPEGAVEDWNNETFIREVHE